MTEANQLKEVGDLLMRVQHRLVCAEVSLTDLRDTARLSRWRYGKRRKKLQKLQKACAQLNSACNYQRAQRLTTELVDIPLQADFGPGEYHIMRAYFADMIRFIEARLKEILAAKKLMKAANLGGMGNWWKLWHLARLKAVLRRSYGVLHGLKNDRKRLHGHVDAMAELANSIPSGQAPLEKLMAIFRNVAATNRDVLKLRKAVEGEAKKNSHMESWLNSQEGAVQPPVSQKDEPLSEAVRPELTSSVAPPAAAAIVPANAPVERATVPYGAKQRSGDDEELFADVQKFLDKYAKANFPGASAEKVGGAQA